MFLLIHLEQGRSYRAFQWNGSSARGMSCCKHRNGSRERYDGVVQNHKSYAVHPQVKSARRLSRYSWDDWVRHDEFLPSVDSRYMLATEISFHCAENSSRVSNHGSLCVSSSDVLRLCSIWSASRWGIALRRSRTAEAGAEVEAATAQLSHSGAVHHCDPADLAFARRIDRGFALVHIQASGKLSKLSSISCRGLVVLRTNHERRCSMNSNHEANMMQPG